MTVSRAIVERLRYGSAIRVIVCGAGSRIRIVAIRLIRVELRKWRDGIRISIFRLVERRRVSRRRARVCIRGLTRKAIKARANVRVPIELGPLDSLCYETLLKFSRPHPIHAGTHRRDRRGQRIVSG